jgi:3-oxoacyl-[acyl-carrier protein] reductase
MPEPTDRPARRALVTGASRGIGRATAECLARDGVQLAVHGHTHPDELQTLVDSLDTAPTAFSVLADLKAPTGCAALASAVQARWDSLDVLVHCAGVYPRVNFDQLSWSSFEDCLALNLVAPAELIRLLLPQLRRARHGRIVFVSSVMAFTGSAHGAHYAAAKAGLLGLARSLARELAPDITVNVVAPGAIDTAILAGDSPLQRRERERSIPLGRVGTPREVAEVIAFLASERARYITGTTLHVNGGWWTG